MARRRKTSPLEDVMTLFARLPWWAGVATAVVSYFVLHALAGREVQTAVQPGQMGTAITQGVTTALAKIGQYLLPLLCLVGAGLSAIGRKKRKVLLKDVAQSRASDALDGMSWREFELLIGEAFRKRGYQVAETGGNGPDGGVDLVLRKGGEKYLVQCKQWKALKVGVEVVRELYGVMAAQGATTGFVVTSGRFTKDAEAFAHGRNVRLIDGPQLLEMIRGAQTPPAAAARGSATRQPAPRAAAIARAPAPMASRPASSVATAEPDCPVCAKPMVRRQAKRGAHAGQTFWGCTAYPGCRGTRQDA